ncbi:dihydroorotase [Chloroflexota bacterium]
MNNKQRNLLIDNGRIIDPSQGIDHVGRLLISNGEIIWIGKAEATPPLPVYDTLHAQDLIVCPGFIDLHCHLRQPGFEEKETIATGTQAAARGGFTTVCCMPNTNPPLDNPDTIYYVKSTATAEGVVRVLPIGCISKGRKGRQLAQLEDLASSGVIGFSDDGSPVKGSRLMQQALECSYLLNLPIIDHCEDKTLTRGGVMNEGELATKLELVGIPAAAEEKMIARDLRISKLTGGWLHIAHVSTAGSVNIIRHAKQDGIRVTAEVTPHHLTLTENALIGYNTNAKVNPPLRTKKDTSELIQGLKDNTIDIIATDHAPHTEMDKCCEIYAAQFGISVFETAFGSLMSLVHDNQIDLTTLITKLTTEPANFIGNKYGKLGTLSKGAPADITIFNPNIEWTVDTNDFTSKGKNTPLNGLTLKGKIMATVSRGEIIYKDDRVKFETRG